MPAALDPKTGQTLRNILALMDYPGWSSLAHTLGIVTPQIRMAFQFGAGAVDLELSGTAAVGRNADPNLAAWMPADQEYYLLVKRYRGEWLPSTADWGGTVSAEGVALNQLAMEHNPSGGNTPFYYPLIGYVTPGAPPPRRTFGPGSADTAEYLDVIETEQKWYDMKSIVPIDMAKDTFRLFTLGTVVIPASDPVFNLIFDGIAVSRDVLEGTKPSPLTALSAYITDDNMNNPGYIWSLYRQWGIVPGPNKDGG